MCLKMDIQKAFESVSKNLILFVPRRKWFPIKFIKRIAVWILNFYFPVLTNGKVVFSPSKRGFLGRRSIVFSDVNTT